MRYPEYKTINLPWLSEIPKDWSIIRNKNILKEQKNTVGEKSDEHTLLSLTINGIIKRDMESGKGKFPKEFDSYKVVQKGNIVFCLFDIDETPRTVGLSTYDGMITGAYDVFAIKGINSRYLYYYYLALDSVKALKPLYTGLRKVIGVPHFLSTKMPLPSLEEQNKIVKFLDWKIGMIDKLIPQNDMTNIINNSNCLFVKEIALLNEFKISLMTKVTSGQIDVRDIEIPEFEIDEDQANIDEL